MPDALNQLGDDTPLSMQQQLSQQQTPMAQAAGSQANSNVPQQQQPGGFFKSMLASILQGVAAGAGVGAGGDSRHADIGAAFHAGAEGAQQNSPLAIAQRNQAAQQQSQAFQTTEELRQQQLANGILQNRETMLRLMQMNKAAADPLEAAAEAHAADAMSRGAGSIVGTNADRSVLEKQWAQIHGDGGPFLQHEIVPYKNGQYALVQIKQGQFAPDKDIHYTFPGNKDYLVPPKDITWHAGEDSEQFWKVRYPQELNDQSKNLSIGAATAREHEETSEHAAAANLESQTRLRIADIEDAAKNAAVQQRARESNDGSYIKLVQNEQKAYQDLATLANKRGTSMMSWFTAKSPEEKQAGVVAAQATRLREQYERAHPEVMQGPSAPATGPSGPPTGAVGIAPNTTDGMDHYHDKDGNDLGRVQP